MRFASSIRLPRLSPLRVVSSWVACVVAASSVGVACSDTGKNQSTSLGQRAEDLQAGNFDGASLPAKTLALTFDDGPGDRAAELSAYLKAQNIRAAFFVNGARINATALPNPNGIGLTNGVAGILANLVADGHLVSNHTVTHRDMVNTVQPAGGGQLLQEIAETDTDIANYIPSKHFLFRPPFGSWSQGVYDALKASAMNKYVGPINWDAGGFSNAYPNAAADWACWQGQLYAGNVKANGTGYATTQQCGDAYMKEITTVGRGIVLMHDPYAWANGNTVDMVKYMVPLLKAQGYSFVRVDEVPSIVAQLPAAVCDATCATCTSPEASACVTCPSTRYLNNRSCLACTVCTPGNFASTACAGSTNTVCSACDAGCATCTAAATQCTSCAPAKFLSGAACQACSTCGNGKYQASACSAAKDTVCSACDASCASCTGPSANECASCPASSYLAAGACHACGVCKPGTFEGAACTSAKDATCTPCAAGTYSDTAGAKTCAACPDGSKPNAEANACVPGNPPPLDAGSDASGPTPDASTGSDSGAADADVGGMAAPIDTSGCSCDVTGKRTSSGGPSMAFAFGVAIVVSRRRKRLMQ